MPPRSEWGWLSLVGFLGVYLNQLLFAIGVYNAGAIIAAIMQLAVSPTTTALAILLKMEKFSILKIVGIILSTIGSLIIIDFSNFSISSGSVPPRPKKLYRLVSFSRHFADSLSAGVFRVQVRDSELLFSLHSRYLPLVIWLFRSRFLNDFLQSRQRRPCTLLERLSWRLPPWSSYH